MDFARVEQPSPLMQAALMYAAEGRAVFPCGSNKQPLIRNGFKGASTDRDQIISWWTQWPTAFIGMPTGAITGIAVIDLDHKPNSANQPRNGTAALAEITQGETWGDTVEVRTPTGGRHIWFKHQAGFKCSTNDELGIDVRAEGGYVCVPPSAGYIFEKPTGLFPVAEAPDFLVPVLRDGTRQKPAPAPHEPYQAAVGQSVDETRPEDVEAVLNDFWNPDDYQDWSTAALALHNLPGGREIWLAWSARSAKFNAAENDKKWRQTVPTRNISARSILARAPKAVLSDMGKARHPAQEFAMFRAGQTGQPDYAKQFSPTPIKTASFLELMTEDVVEEPDYIDPDFLGPGNFCLIAGPPKAQKSFLLQEILVACAIGGGFLGGKFTVSRPLRVFYLQAEMNRKLLRRRAKAMTFLSAAQKQLLATNFIVTERFAMLLNENGVGVAIQTITESFKDGPPDIIAMDPLANLFDGESEDRAPEMMAFLVNRVEKIRQAVNPAAAIIMVHHSSKKTSDDMNRDPFVAIRGSGALRGHYDTGVIIFRKSEDGSERRLFIETRAGESPDPMTIRFDNGRFLVVDTSVDGVPRNMAVAILEEIEARWRSGKPLSTAAQTGKEGRYVMKVIPAKFEIAPEALSALLDGWLMNGILAVEIADSRSKTKGLKVIGKLDIST